LCNDQKTKQRKHKLTLHPRYLVEVGDHAARALAELPFSGVELPCAAVPSYNLGIFIFKKGRETSILRVVAEKVNDVCKRRGLKPNYLARRVGRFSLKRLSLD
jgi:hypothetical protein